MQSGLRRSERFKTSATSFPPLQHQVPGFCYKSFSAEAVMTFFRRQLETLKLMPGRPFPAGCVAGSANMAEADPSLKSSIALTCYSEKLVPNYYQILSSGLLIAELDAATKEDRIRPVRG